MADILSFLSTREAFPSTVQCSMESEVNNAMSTEGKNAVAVQCSMESEVERSEGQHG